MDKTIELKEVIYLSGGDVICVNGEFYKKLSTDDIIKEIPTFCKSCIEGEKNA